ncbi:PIR protein [Plasmodium ovale]|uniref:PIR protein n=1 Tax=Plasmodium ovale TaxID=36330 RepID=A0A1C3KEW7_PLAOA|nr:PIR protein [Plasmodium ovale]
MEDTLDVVLTGLPSYKTYKKLNEDVKDISVYNADCANVKSYETNYSGSNKLCAKIARNFKDVSNFRSRFESHKDADSYLSYWIYDEIRKIFSTNNKPSNVPLAEQFLNVMNNVYKKSNGGRLFDASYNYELETMREEKILFDYFVNFNNFISNIKTDNHKCNKYCDYVSYVKSLYDKHKYLDDYDCCLYHDCYDYFKCDAEYEPDKVLTILKEEAEEPAKFTKVVNAHVNNEQQDFFTTYEHERGTSERGANLGYTHGDVRTPEVRDHEASSSSVAIPLVHTLLENPDQVSHNNLENLNDDLKVYIFRVIMSFILIIGLLYLFKLYFKLDRLGTWFRKKIRRKKRFTYTVDNELDDQLKSDDSQYLYINTINGSLRIAYNTHCENYELT